MPCRRGGNSSAARHSALRRMALASLFADERSARARRTSGAGQNPLAPRAPHFPPRAKRVIFLYMLGGPSQLDLFDPKPVLAQRDGEVIPDSFLKKIKFAADPGQAAPADGNSVEIRSPRRMRSGRLRTVALHGPGRRSIVDRAHDAGRRHEPHVRRIADQHGLASVRSTEHGLVDRLRIGERVAGFAGLLWCCARACLRARKVPTTGTAFFPRRIKACRCGRRANRSSICPIRKGSRRRGNGERSTR